MAPQNQLREIRAVSENVPSERELVMAARARQLQAELDAVRAERQADLVALQAVRAERARLENQVIHPARSRISCQMLNQLRMGC